MIAFATKVLGGLWAKIAIVGAILLGVLIFLGRVRQAGVDAEKSKAKGKILEAVEKRHEVDARVAVEPDPAGKLRERWSRD